MSTWDAVSRAAAAMRRLNRALSGRRLPDDTLEEVSVAVHDLADRFDAGTKRSKLDDMMTRPHLAAIYSGQYTPLELAVGEEIEFDPFSLAGGEFHPASIGLIFIKESDDSVVGAGEYTVVVLEVEPLGISLPSVSMEGPELKYRFGRSVEAATGIQIFGTGH